MVVRILDITQGADTADQGSKVHQRILDALKAGGRVVISFDGVQTASSSFVNVCLVQLLDHMSLDDLKKRIAIIHSNHQINEMIKRSFNRPLQPNRQAA